MTKNCSRNKRHNLSEGLSNLPDSVLAHVLSFLPTTDEVVRTSVLSKRWKSLWTYVNTLIFVDWKKVVPEKMKFSQFVYRVLQFHRGSIKKMMVSCGGKGVDEYDIRSWISIAIDRDVEILEIRPGEPSFRWPLSLFTSERLVDLNIGSVDFTNLSIPSAPFFPSLKKLNIRVSYFVTEALQRLISGCLVLEDLHIWMIFNNISLNLSSSTLKRLEVICAGIITKFIAPSYYHKIELTVPALEFLKVRTPPTEFILEDQLPFLTEADIIIFSTPIDVNEYRFCQSLVRFMEHISNVKVLRLNCDFKKQPLTFPMHAEFHNLTKLEIMSCFFEWTLLRSFMESSINLEFIDLKQKFAKKKEKQVFWIDPQNVPQCLLSSIRKISIEGHSIENVRDMVDYVLRNAEVLEMMDIKKLDFNDDDYKAQYQILQKLSLTKRASRRCELSFV